MIQFFQLPSRSSQLVVQSNSASVYASNIFESDQDDGKNIESNNLLWKKI